MQVSDLDSSPPRRRQPEQHQAPPEADVPQAGAQAPQQTFPPDKVPEPQLLSSPRTRQVGNMDWDRIQPKSQLLKWPDVASLLKRTGIKWDSGRS